jgi:hypothetical protein
MTTIFTAIFAFYAGYELAKYLHTPTKKPKEGPR